MNCIVCKKLIKDCAGHYCSDSSEPRTICYFDRHYQAIKKGTFYIDYDFSSKRTLFRKDNVVFYLETRFKVINNSVEDTYNHYRKFHIFS